MRRQAPLALVVVVPLHVLKGSTFVAISDLVVGRAAPSSGALEGETATTLGRLP